MAPVGSFDSFKVMLNKFLTDDFCGTTTCWKSFFLVFLFLEFNQAKFWIKFV